MGGLRQYMPITFVLMWIATLAIAGIPPLAGFFSKDEILGALFARAQGSTLAQAHLFGIPGTVWLYFAWVLGLACRAHDGRLHDAHDAVHLPRSESHRRRGAAASAGSAVGHDRPAGRAGGAHALSAAGSTCPSSLPLGPVGGLDHWLEPVVGEATKRVIGGAAPVAPGLELGTGRRSRSLIALVGIGIAVVRLKPQTLVPKSQSPQEEGFEKVLVNKYYVDEIYDDAIVKPIVGTSRGLSVARHRRRADRWTRRRTAAGKLTRFVGWVGSQFQSGQRRHVRVGAGHRSPRRARRRDRAVIRFQHRNSCSAF